MLINSSNGLRRRAGTARLRQAREPGRRSELGQALPYGVHLLGAQAEPRRRARGGRQQQRPTVAQQLVHERSDFYPLRSSCLCLQVNLDISAASWGADAN